MGKSITPTFRIVAPYVDFVAKKRDTMTMEWRTAQHGKPTPKNIEKWLLSFEKSMLEGGCNAHLVNSMSPFSSAKVIRQKTNEIVAEFSFPMFTV